MYAILQQGGHQYRVAPGDRLLVDRLEAEVGSVVALEPVLLVSDGDATTVGSPTVEGARIAAVVVSHRKGRKIRVFKYKAKKRYRRTHGHRSLLTELRVETVLAAGEDLPIADAARVVTAKATPAAKAAPTAKAAPAAKAAPSTKAASAAKAAPASKPAARSRATAATTADEE